MITVINIDELLANGIINFEFRIIISFPLL